jgi:hypothetical protein
MGVGFPWAPFLASFALASLVFAELTRRFLSPSAKWKWAVVVASAASFWGLYLRDGLHRYFFEFYWLPIFGPKIILLVTGPCAISWTLAARRSGKKTDWAAAAAAWGAFLLMLWVGLCTGRMSFSPDD